MPTTLTRCSTSQSRSASNARVIVRKVRVWLRRPPLPSGVRTHAVSDFLPMSNPAHRSMIVSTAPPPDTTAPSGGASSRQSLTLVLTATIRCTRGSRVRLLNGLAAPRLPDASGRHPIFILRGGAVGAMEDCSADWTSRSPAASPTPSTHCTDHGGGADIKHEPASATTADTTQKMPDHDLRLEY